MTKLIHKTTDPAQDKLDLLALVLFENEKGSARTGMDALLGGSASKAEKQGDFKGKAREQILLYPHNGARAQRVIFAGLGKRDKASLEGLRKVTGGIVTKAIALKARTLGIVLAGGQVETALDASDAAAAVAEAAVMAAFKFERFKSQAADTDEAKKKPEKKTPAPELQVTIYTSKDAAVSEAIDLAVIGAEAANVTRDLGNEPANVATPARMAEVAIEAGRRAGFKVSVIEKAEMKKLGMNLLLAVNAGSEVPPKFIVMEYEPPKAVATKGTKKLPVVRDVFVLVGKGITFDSGGISIKPADKMWDMKFDKCGGCAVIGAMQAVATAKLPIRVIGLVPATENLPSGTATRPGDIVKGMSGKTVEIQNTDAEGRLILADALCYAKRYEPTVVIDVATLTGACVVALGDVRAGLMGNDEGLLAELKAAGDHTGEKVWPLPLDDEYGEHVKSDYADVKNLGRAGQAGAISAGYFLKHFAPAKAKWAHMDIAGTAWGSDGKGYIGKGATGFGVRILFEFLRRRAAGGRPSRKGAKARAR